MKLVILFCISMILLGGCVTLQEREPYPGAFEVIEIHDDFTKYHFYDENVTCFAYNGSKIGEGVSCLEGLK